MSLKNELVNAVREAQAAQDKAAAELARISKMYKMTDEGIVEHRERLYSAAREVANTAKRKGLEAIERACLEMDAQDKEESARRSADVAYLQRLEQKIRLAQTIGKIDRQSNNGYATQDRDTESLKSLFSEFAGDPLAVAAIRQAIGPDKSFFYLPEESSGPRQQHLKGKVTKLFERAMNEAQSDSDTRVNEIDAFVSYCTAQDDAFSCDDMAVWQGMRDQRVIDGTPNAVRFDMALTMG